MDLPINSARRKIIVAWLAFSIGFVSFVLLSITSRLTLALQFSFCLVILTWICFRWWTNPVHPGIFGYISPYTIICLYSLIYYGIGNLPALMYPEMLRRANYGARDFYLPMIMITIMGLVVLEICYRKVSRWVKLNDSLNTCLDNFYSPHIQSSIPVLAIAWYFITGGIFWYMSGTYVMQPFKYVGAQGDMDTIFVIAGQYLLGTAWTMIGLMLFRQGKKFWRIISLVMLLSLVPIIFGYQNRRLAIFCSVILVITFSLYHKQIPVLRLFLIGGGGIFLSLLLISSIKIMRIPSVQRYLSEEKSLFRRTQVILSSSDLFQIESLIQTYKMNMLERLSGLDYPAAIMEANVNAGIPFMKGEHNLLAASQIIPRMLWRDKPILGPEGVIDRYYELTEADQISSILLSAYADGGTLGVILFFGLLGLFFPLVIRLIFIRREGIIVYMLGLIVIFNFEHYVAWYSLRWLRWVLIVMVVNSTILFILKLLQVRRSTIET